MLSLRVLGVRDVPRPPPEGCAKGTGSVIWTVQVNHGVQQHRTHFVATPGDKNKSEEVSCGCLSNCALACCCGVAAPRLLVFWRGREGGIHKQPGLPANSSFFTYHIHIRTAVCSNNLVNIA